MLANQSKAKVCPKHLKSCSPKESSVSLQTFVHIWRYETKNNFLQIRVREDMQKNCQSSSWKFSFSTPRQDQKLWKCIAIVVGSWAFLLPSFSTTLRPLIISPNLQFNTFRPFSLPLQPDPNLCLSICTGRKKPASFIERETLPCNLLALQKSLFGVPPLLKVFLHLQMKMWKIQQC